MAVACGRVTGVRVAAAGVFVAAVEVGAVLSVLDFAPACVPVYAIAPAATTQPTKMNTPLPTSTPPAMIIGSSDSDGRHGGGSGKVRTR